MILTTLHLIEYGGEAPFCEIGVDPGNVPRKGDFVTFEGVVYEVVSVMWNMPIKREAMIIGSHRSRGAPPILGEASIMIKRISNADKA
jgi:hypothetical protein